MQSGPRGIGGGGRQHEEGGGRGGEREGEVKGGMDGKEGEGRRWEVSRAWWLWKDER